MTAKRNLVLFDLDGTITTKDTLFLFLAFTHGQMGMAFGLMQLAPYFALYGLKQISAQRMKELLFGKFYAGWSSLELCEAGERFAAAFISNPTIVRPVLIQTLNKAVLQGHSVCIVSASPSIWVRPFATSLHVAYISTELAFDADGIFRGKLNGANMNGQHKATAIKERYALADYEKVIAFGNSNGDAPMLALAHEPHWIK